MQLTQSYQLLDTKQSTQIIQSSFRGYFVSKLYVKYSDQDTLTRTAKIWLKLTFELKSSSGYWGIYDNNYYTQTLSCDASSLNASKKINNGNAIYSSTGELTLYEQDFTVTYDNDGTWSNKTVSGVLRWWDSSHNANPNGTVSLPEIHIGSFDISSFNETQVTIEWETEEIPSQVRAVATQNGVPIQTIVSLPQSTIGIIVVNGLTPNKSTTVNVYGTFNGYESLIGYTRTITTQRIPYASVLPNLIIGNALNVTIENPNSRTFTAQLWTTNGQNYIAQKTGQTGTTVTFTNAEIRQSLYQNIPSGNLNNTYYIKTYFSSFEDVSELGTYSVNSSYALPQVTLQGVSRVSDSSGTTEDPNGAYAKITFAWSVTNVDNNHATSIVFENTQNNIVVATQTVSLSGLNGTTSVVFACDTDKQYIVNCKMYDEISTYMSRYSTNQAIVPKAYLPLSLFEDDNGNVGVRFGLQAVRKGWDFVTKNGDFPVMIDGININNIFAGKRTLLWTNPNDSLGATTISLDLSQYSHIVVGGFRNDEQSGGVGYVESICPIGHQSVLSYIGYSTDNVSSTERFMLRTMRGYWCSTTGVTFDSGQMTYTGGLYRNWNNRMFPKYIWGINL